VILEVRYDTKCKRSPPKQQSDMEVTPAKDGGGLLGPKIAEWLINPKIVPKITKNDGELFHL